MTPRMTREDMLAHLSRRLALAQRDYAIAWARSQAAQFPGIQFIALVGDTMYAYEADDDGRIRSHNV